MSIATAGHVSERSARRLLTKFFRGVFTVTLHCKPKSVICPDRGGQFPEGWPTESERVVLDTYLVYNKFIDYIACIEP